MEDERSSFDIIVDYMSYNYKLEKQLLNNESIPVLNNLINKYEVDHIIKSIDEIVIEFLNDPYVKMNNYTDSEEMYYRHINMFINNLYEYYKSKEELEKNNFKKVPYIAGILFNRFPECGLSKEDIMNHINRIIFLNQDLVWNKERFQIMINGALSVVSFNEFTKSYPNNGANKNG